MTHEEIVKRALEDQDLINKEIEKKAWIQTEEIVWNKYPERKPRNNETYLVTYRGIKGSSTLNWINIDWQWDGDKVIAWAKQPTGWMELIPRKKEK